MEDSANKEQLSASGKSTSKLLRYPLRSAAKLNDDKPPLADSANSASAAKRAAASSVGVLDLSAKEKSSAKPPRRLSIPSKSSASPAAKSFGNVTPISEVRTKRVSGNQGKSGTPVSDLSKLSSRKKFSVLSSASYWLSQIKLSESASKHLISLGFFKLALEAKCEPMQRMSDELKSYVRRHNLSDLGDLTKELFASYNISFEQSKFMGIRSQVLAEGNRLSDENSRSSSSLTDTEILTFKSLESGADETQQVKKAHTEVNDNEEGNKLSDDDMHSSSSSVTGAKKLKPKSLDIGANQVEKARRLTPQKKDSVKTRRSANKNNLSAKASSEIKGHSSQKKPQKPKKQETSNHNDKLKKQLKKTAARKGPLNSEQEKPQQENKENMASPQVEETRLVDV